VLQLNANFEHTAYSMLDLSSVKQGLGLKNIDLQTYNKTQHKMVTISFSTWALFYGIG
jgi:hypothetical protein